MIVKSSIHGIDVNFTLSDVYVQKPNPFADCRADVEGYAEWTDNLCHSDNTEYTKDEWDEVLYIYNSLSDDELDIIFNDIEKQLMTL